MQIYTVEKIIDLGNSIESVFLDEEKALTECERLQKLYDVKYNIPYGYHRTGYEVGSYTVTK